MENNNQQSFWQFSDQLRLHSANLANLSLNDSIWSSNKRPDDRTNFDVGSYLNSSSNNNKPASRSPLNGIGYGWRAEKSNLGSDFNDGGYGYGWKMNAVADLNGFDDGWKLNSGPIGSPSPQQQNFAVNGGFNKGLYSKSATTYLPPNNNNVNLNFKGHKNKAEDFYGSKMGKRNGNTKKNNVGEINNNSVDDRVGSDKRFKTLPPSESLPKNEMVGGYIFVCNNDTMEENLKRQLFGLPPRYRDSVRQITPGLPLFLYNYSTHQLHGIFEAASFGGSNIDPTAWEDKKCPGESRFPAQVQVILRKVCDPLEEDAFRPILHHYDGPKFRLELSVPEALSLLDIFANQDSNITGIQTPIENL